MLQPAANPVLSIVVVSYNTRELTLACLASIYAQTETPFEIIVVDNNSSDGSAEAIAKTFPQAQLIAETTNHGFAPAHDIAVPLARAPWLLLLNPDTVVLDHALDRLLEFALRCPNAEIWGGRTVYGDGQLNLSSCWGRMTLWSTFCRTTGLSGLFRTSELFNSEGIGTWQRDCEREVDIVTGCLFLIRREFWDRLDGFEAAFTMYGEEVDLCLRARVLGARPAITPNATIVHYGAASDTVVVEKMIRLLRAKVELINRHFSPQTRWLGHLLFLRWPQSRAVAFGILARLRDRDSDRIRAESWRSVWKRRSEWKNGFSGQ